MKTNINTRDPAPAQGASSASGATVPHRRGQGGQKETRGGYSRATVKRTVGREPPTLKSNENNRKYKHHVRKTQENLEIPRDPGQGQGRSSPSGSTYLLCVLI